MILYSLKWHQVNLITEANHGKYRSSYRPGNEALAEANQHAARLRRRNRRQHWIGRFWPPFGSRKR